MNLTSVANWQHLSIRPRQARRQLRTLMKDSGWGGEVEPVLLAVHEALVNAQRHGGGIDRVLAAVDGPLLHVEVCDRGGGFEVIDDALVRSDPGRPDPMSETGRGLWIISRVASSADVRRDGDLVCLRMRFDQRDQR